MPDYKDLGLDQNMRALSSLSNSAYLTDRDFKQYIDDRVRNVRRPGGLDFQAVKNTSLGYQAVVGKDNTGGAFTDIQDAVNYVSSVGGGNIFIRQGTYALDKTVILPSNIHITGESIQSVKIDTSTIGITEGIDSAAFHSSGTLVSTAGSISITNGTNTVSGTGSSFMTDGVQVGDYISINSHMYEIGSVINGSSITILGTFNGIDTTGLPTYIVRPQKNLSINNLTIDGGTSDIAVGMDFYYTHFVSIKNIILNNGVSGLGLIDTWISDINNILISNTYNSLSGAYAVYMRTGYDQILTRDGGQAGNISSVNNVFCLNNSQYGIAIQSCQGVKLTNCHSANNGLDGFLLDDCSNVSLVECTSFKNRWNGLRVTTSTYDNVSSDNVRIIGGNYSFNGSSGILLSKTSGTFNINDTTIIGVSLRNNARYGLEIGTTANLTSVIGNSFDSNGTSILDSGTSTFLVYNTGLITQSSGLGTVGATTTVGTVTHGLYSTPSVVNITPRNSLGSASNFFTSSIGATTFLINTNTAPGTAVVFSWTAEV